MGSPWLSKGIVLVFSCALLAVAPPAASAQVTTGSIFGMVKDASGGVLPGATVVATTNAFNFVNLDNPNTDVRSSRFGQIDEAEPMRRIQLGARFSF